MAEVKTLPRLLGRTGLQDDRKPSDSRPVASSGELQSSLSRHSGNKVATTVGPRVLKVAAYGGIGVGALAGWSIRFFLKYIFTQELAVTGSAGVSEGGVVHADLLANMLGTFVFGLLSKNETLLKPWHPSVFVGIGTGFCGSCTTFSSWMVEAGVQMWTPLGSAGDSFWAQQLSRGTLLIIVGLLCLLSSLHMGQAVGSRLAFMVQQRTGHTEAAVVAPEAGANTPVAPVPLYQGKHAALCWSVLAALWTLVLCFVSSASWLSTERLSTDLLAGMCFAPLGAWLRFELSKYNSRVPRFPAFTFLANILGTMLSVACWLLAMELEPEDDRHLFLRSRIWVVAVSGGLCGCLSTASTFANELDKLSCKDGEISASAFKYGVASILSAQVVIAGVVNSYLATQ